MVWQLGNTSVRSALRIRDGLVALSTSAIQGNIRKGDGDRAFRALLGECGVVSLGEDSTQSVGRKWRSAMGKLGFLFPEIKRSMGFHQNDLGQPDMITPAGWNLIRAETVPAMQECFLRAMISPLTVMGNGQTFSPLCWTLAVLIELERRTGTASVSFPEMACIVQTTSPSSGLQNAVDDILRLRRERDAAERKRPFDRAAYKRYGELQGCKPRTLVDYADMNMRYLKATGMVRSHGKGIALIPERHALALALTRELTSRRPLLDVYRGLCSGNPLPTDNAVVARRVLNDLLTQIARYGIEYSIAGRPLDTAAQINQVRYEVEELISERQEEDYAAHQAEQWQEIAAYMDLIASHRERMDVNGVEISVSRTEAPAYLEWCLWRAFLAIDTLVNKPYEVRRFKVDQDFLPVSTAPGNGPDLIAEFADCLVVIEVTLSENSRQEAMEGEPVRRHVADLMQRYDKPVYGLFIANRIDSNTAETFRIGVWYTKEDARLELRIVPFTLTQFSSFFKAMFLSGRASPSAITTLISECERLRGACDAPEWKEQIGRTVENTINAM